MKIMVLLWSTSVEKDISIVPSLFFSLFLIWAFFLFFSFFLLFLIFWPLFFHSESHPDLWGNHSLHHPFLTWDNALMMIITTLLFTYNSRITTQYLKQNMTLCECLRRCTGMSNDAWVTCMKNYERWLCHKYDVNYMIMQSNMTMMKCVIITERWKVAWKYISEWLWKCIIGRYGGYFEEGIWLVYGTGDSCTILERLAMVEGESAYNPWNQH